MGSINNFHQRIRQLIRAKGGDTDGNEVFYFTFPTQLGMVRGVRAVVGVRNASPAIRGSFLGTFDNVSLKNMFKNLPEPVVAVYNPTSSQDIVNAIIDKYGLLVEPEWFRSFPVKRPPFTAKIDFVDSYWTVSDQDQYADNRITVTVEQPVVDVADLFKNVVLDKPVMPWPRRLGYTNTELLTYGVDFTPNFDEDFIDLTNIKEDADLNSDEDPHVWRSNTIIRLLKERLGIPVVRTAGIEGQLSLYGAKLLYNGPATGFATADVWYDNVLVFTTEIDPTVEDAVFSYRGTIYVHYNNVI